MKYTNFGEFESQWNERFRDLFPNHANKGMRYYSSAEAVGNGEPMSPREVREKLNKGEMLWGYSPVAGFTMPFMKNENDEILTTEDLLNRQTEYINALRNRIEQANPEKPPKPSRWSRFLNFFGYKTQEMKKYDTDKAAYEKERSDKAAWEAEVQNREENLRNVRETVDRTNELVERHAQKKEQDRITEQERIAEEQKRLAREKTGNLYLDDNAVDHTPKAKEGHKIPFGIRFEKPQELTEEEKREKALNFLDKMEEKELTLEEEQEIKDGIKEQSEEYEEKAKQLEKKTEQTLADLKSKEENFPNGTGDGKKQLSEKEKKEIEEQEQSLIQKELEEEEKKYEEAMQEKPDAEKEHEQQMIEDFQIAATGVDIGGDMKKLLDFDRKLYKMANGVEREIDLYTRNIVDPGEGNYLSKTAFKNLTSSEYNLDSKSPEEYEKEAEKLDIWLDSPSDNKPNVTNRERLIRAIGSGATVVRSEYLQNLTGRQLLDHVKAHQLKQIARMESNVPMEDWPDQKVESRGKEYLQRQKAAAYETLLKEDKTPEEVEHAMAVIMTASLLQPKDYNEVYEEESAKLSQADKKKYGELLKDIMHSGKNKDAETVKKEEKLYQELMDDFGKTGIDMEAYQEKVGQLIQGNEEKYNDAMEKFSAESQEKYEQLPENVKKIVGEKKQHAIKVMRNENLFANQVEKLKQSEGFKVCAAKDSTGHSLFDRQGAVMAGKYLMSSKLDHRQAKSDLAKLEALMMHNVKEKNDLYGKHHESGSLNNDKTMSKEKSSYLLS